MTNSFSLLRLPNEERLQVLRCMDRLSLLLLSLLSRNTKDLVRSLRLKPIRHYFVLGSSSLFEGLDLEDLLICNAHHITFSVTQQFDNINQFLKLWVKGANPRLQKLTIQQRILFNPEDILKGVKIHREIPQGENIVYGEDPVWHYEYRTRAVDIKRYDGTRGTIVMYYSTRFVLLVWS
ncbi:unnamed protein product [Caenorhabditis brenneri]